MFFSQNNNSDGVVSTNTTITTLYGELSSLTIGAWNEKINLRFSPSIGKDGNGLNQYDKERTASTALTQRNAFSLLKLFNSEIRPKYENKEEIGEGINVAISMGRPDSRNILMIEYKPDENKENRFYLTFAQNVSSDGKVPDENKISYKFAQTDAMTDYKTSDGSGNSVKIESELETFLTILNHRNDILPMISHSIRHSNEIGKRYANKNNSNQNYGNSNSGFNSGSFDNSFTEMEEGLPFN